MNVKFGDVVKEVKSNVDRANNPYEFYVAGDHMDSEDFRIHRHGCFATDDVGPAFVRIFHPGQVLYGSRRTYLKKVCVADFDGVCSNTTFVLETKDENVLVQRLLPFLLLSNGFTEWSIKHSKGSTNPYVLFSDLAGYEFDLPPMDEQKKLAELLWAANDLKESYKKAITATDEMLKAKFREMFGDVGDDSSRRDAETRRGGSHGVTSKHPMVPLEEVCKILTDGTHLPPKFSDLGIPFLFVSNIQNNKLTYETNKYITLEQYKVLIKRTPIEIGDVLLTTVGSYGNPAVVESDKPFCFQRHIAYLKLKRDLIEPNFLHAVLLSEKVRNQIDTAAQGCAQKTVTLTSLRSIQIPLPPLSLQREFVAIADKAESAKANLKKSIAAIDQVMKGLINQ